MHAVFCWSGALIFFREETKHFTLIGDYFGAAICYFDCVGRHGGCLPLEVGRSRPCAPALTLVEVTPPPSGLPAASGVHTRNFVDLSFDAGSSMVKAPGQVYHS